MPTTPLGLRYPASSAAPNVPQDIQNLANDVDFGFSNRQWLTTYRGTSTYDHTIASGSFVTVPNMTLTPNIPAGRQVEIEASLPSIEFSTGGLVTVRLLMDGVEEDVANIQVSAPGTHAVKLTGHLFSATTRSAVPVSVQALKVGTGTYKISAASTNGPRLRVRLI